MGKPKNTAKPPRGLTKREKVEFLRSQGTAESQVHRIANEWQAEDDAAGRPEPTT